MQMNLQKNNKQNDLEWAKNLLDDIVFGCILNIKFYQSGICEKLFIDMYSSDLEEYKKLLAIIFNDE